MSLQLIVGNSGSGKSHRLYEKLIAQSREHPEENYIVIVPEQFTMQTQRDLVMLHPDGGIRNIDVLSFQRLAHRIFEEVGADRRSVLTETGKNLMLRKVAMEQKDALQVLGGRMNRPGYISEVKSMLSELMQYEITDFELQQMIEFAGGRPLLRAKLADLRVLYRAFLDYQRERFMKPEELMDVLCQVAGDSRLLRRSVLAFDGFAGFAPSQLKVLRELLAICPKVWVTVTIDVREAFFGEIQEHELFALSKKLIRGVEKVAREVTQIDDMLLCGKAGLPRFREGGMLLHLEQNLFRRRREVYGKTAAALPSARPDGAAGRTGRQGFTDDIEGFELKTENPRAEAPASGEAEISLHSASTPMQEVHFAARTISRLVRERGYRYREIAIITGNLSSYDSYIKKLFPLYEIPAFLDETRHILLNPCLEFVRGALNAAEKDFSCEAVFRFLRTGMTDVTPEETDRLENYVLAAGIRGRSRWEREWTYLPKGMSPEELARCNEWRQRAMRQLLPFAHKLRQKDAALRQYADALCELLESCQVQQRLKNRELALEREGAREEAKEYSQIYRILMALLDEMVDLLGEEHVSVSEFSEILDAGVEEARVGIIPPGIDQVQVGDIRRSRLAHVKLLFFLGLNDGWVPARGDGGGIVSDMERELLQDSGVELAPSVRENSYMQRFYLYQNLTKPQDHLYLSWCAMSGDGQGMRPSYLVSTIRKLFPALEIVREQDAGSSVFQLTSKENGMLCLTRGLQELREGRRDSCWLELYASYLRDERYREHVRRLARAAFAQDGQETLSYHISKELYGEAIKASVTRLEQFASCAFAHFALYGLRLSERELYGIRAVDLGILFHSALKRFSDRLQTEGHDWAELADEEQGALMESCVDEAVQEYGEEALCGSAREAYTVRRVKRILCRAAWAMHEQLRAGQFRPAGFEVSFENVGDLEAVHVRFGKSGTMRLQGRIDRIDTAETDDAVYVKIVDYKSGATKFDPVSLYYGLQLQLVVYLNAALEMERRLLEGKQQAAGRQEEAAEMAEVRQKARREGKAQQANVIPAGIFYYHLDDPILEWEEGATDEQMQEKLLKKLRPDGLLNSDETVLRMLDARLAGDSLVIPAGYRKDGTLKAASSAATTEQFAQLSSFVSKKMADMAGEILQGKIEASPFEDKTHSACDYCAYAEVCGFDRRIPGRCRKRTPQLSGEQVWEQIEAETSGERQEAKAWQ